MGHASLNKGEILAAFVIIGLGVFMMWEGARYPFGALQRMGPGFFPVILGLLLIGLGAAVALEVSRLASIPVVSPLRPFLLIFGSITAFALLLPRWGLLPATVALVLLSAAGDRPFRPVAAVVTAAVLVVGGYLVFVRAFGLPLTMLRW